MITNYLNQIGEWIVSNWELCLKILGGLFASIVIWKIIKGVMKYIFYILYSSDDGEMIRINSREIRKIIRIFGEE